MTKPLLNITKKHAYLFAVFLVLYEFLTYVANDMNMPGMIRVIKDLNGTHSDIASSLSFYVYGGASLQIFLGPISDAIGRRKVMLFGAGMFIIFTILIASSRNIDEFLAMRLLQGTGLCFINVIGYTTLQEIFADGDAVRLIAIMANVSTIAPLIGPLLGAMLAESLGWRWIFVSIAACGAVAMWGLNKFMPETVGKTLTNGVKIPKISLRPNVVIKNYWKLMHEKSFLFGSIAYGLISVPCLVWIGLSPVFLMKQAKLDVFQYALWQVPIFAATILGNWLLHYLTRKIPLLNITNFGSWIILVGVLCCWLLPKFDPLNYIYFMPGTLIYFFGLGVITGALYRLVLFSTTLPKGTASAMMSLISMSLEATGVLLINKLYAVNESYELIGLIFTAVCCIAIALLYSIMKKLKFI